MFIDVSERFEKVDASGQKYIAMLHGTMVLEKFKQ
jgi:hypothetical protein